MAYTKTNWVNGSTPINATNLNKIENGISANDSAISAMLNKIYPVNSIIIRDSSTDMSKWLGFTWTKVFAGKVLVGVDTAQTEFNTIGKTGGEKTHTLTVNEMPSHGHSTAVVYPYTAGANHTCTPNASKDRTGTATDVVDKTGGDKPHNNLQPYQVVAYWKRTK